ncbi:hypothetical protein PAECIP111893_00747 [Paenibacillus plantiphilus]|uniref:Carrier domain-containing protein n=1 Tax=Paenibacillus plantiphilus TaxID=2905650 RepID=A0ABM9BXU4_9BACL|nr:phosphopantetheine-binding protein [Paenibacillus plantiphilus]CAH1195722.1 hypothetical protein PAECIP111893_00747 [Paenibacillus plantiphilus]
MNLVVTQTNVTNFVSEKISDLTRKPELKHLLTLTDRMLDFGMTSKIFIQLIVEIEHRYDIYFRDNELWLNGFDSIGDLVDRIVEELYASTAHPFS